MEGLMLLLVALLILSWVATPILLVSVRNRLERVEESLRLLWAMRVQTKEAPKPSPEETPSPTPSAPPQPSVAPTPPPMAERPKPPVAARTRPPSVEQDIPLRPIPRRVVPPVAPSVLQAWLARMGTLATDWLLVRGAFAHEGGASRETALAVHWLIRAGVATVLFGVSFFVRWAIAHGVLGPVGRCSLTVLTGAALVAGGLALLRTRYRIVGEGLAGVGIVALYFALYAATAMFGLLPHAAGFAGMAALTFAAGGVALGLRLPSVAALVTVGGVLTPVLLRAETANLPLLYLYLGLLSVGVSAGAWLRRWDALAVLGFALTWLVSLIAPHDATTPYWFTVLQLLYVLLIFGNLIRRGWKSGWLNFAALLANLAVFWCAFIPLKVDVTVCTVLSLALAGVYALLGGLMRLRGDRRMTWCAALLALVCLALAPVFALNAAGIALAWCLIAVATVELGRHTQEDALTDLGQGFGLFALLSALLMASEATLSVAHFGLGRSSGLLRLVLCLAGTVLVVGHGWWRLNERSELRGRGFALLGWVCSLIYLPLTLCQVRPARMSVLLATVITVMAWSALVPLVLRPRRDWMKDITNVTVWLVTAAVGFWLFVLIFLGEQGEWFAVCAPLAGLLFVAHLLVSGEWLPWRWGFRILAAVFLGLVLSRVAHSVGLQLWGKDAALIAISPAWGLYALALVALGLWKNLRNVRLSGLALFALTLGKVFLVDLADTELLWKVLAALPVGGLLILGAVIYLRLTPKS